MGILTDIIDKLQKLEKKYEKLEAENTQLKDENRRLKSRISELTILTGYEIDILKFLSSHNQSVPEELIARELGLSLTETKKYLDGMWGKFVGSIDHLNEGRSDYHLTQNGRDYLDAINLVE